MQIPVADVIDAAVTDAVARTHDGAAGEARWESTRGAKAIIVCSGGVPVSRESAGTAYPRQTI